MSGSRRREEARDVEPVGGERVMATGTEGENGESIKEYRGYKYKISVRTDGQYDFVVWSTDANGQRDVPLLLKANPNALPLSWIDAIFKSQLKGTRPRQCGTQCRTTADLHLNDDVGKSEKASCTGAISPTADPVHQQS
jgi:hypothetical protein